MTTATRTVRKPYVDWEPPNCNDPNWFVYLAVCEDYAKIGISPFPENRIKTFQTGNPFKIELAAKLHIGTLRETRKIEKALHKRCGEAHVRGEWFDRKTATDAVLELAERMGVTA